MEQPTPGPLEFKDLPDRVVVTGDAQTVNVEIDLMLDEYTGAGFVLTREQARALRDWLSRWLEIEQ